MGDLFDCRLTVLVSNELDALASVHSEAIARLVSGPGGLCIARLLHSSCDDCACVYVYFCRTWKEPMLM